MTSLHFFIEKRDDGESRFTTLLRYGSAAVVRSRQANLRVKIKSVNPKCTIVLANKPHATLTGLVEVTVSELILTKRPVH